MEEKMEIEENMEPVEVLPDEIPEVDTEEVDVAEESGDAVSDGMTVGEVTVSGGDSIMLDSPMMYTIAEGVQTLADSSVQGYLSSSIVSVFDRLVDNGNYRYYVAYRANYEDNNSGYLYLSNKVNGTQLEDCQVIHMYRVNTGNNYEYTYHYDVYYDDAEWFNLGNGGLYYTNIAAGYPSLGSPVQSKMYSWLPVLVVTVFLGALMIRRKIREC